MIKTLFPEHGMRTYQGKKTQTVSILFLSASLCGFQCLSSKKIKLSVNSDHIYEFRKGLFEAELDTRS